MATAARARDGTEALRERLEARRGEIEQEALTRICTISDPGEVTDPTYREGLRAAVSAAIGWGLGALAHDGARPKPVPVALLAQARLAARNGVSLDVVLRRYFAGYRLLNDLLVSEAAGLPTDGLRGVLDLLTARFDRLLAAVGEEFRREDSPKQATSRQRQAELVEALLAGELLDHSAPAGELAYVFDCHHIGLAAAGPAAADAIVELAAGLDCRALVVPRTEQMVWGWIGARRPIDATEIAARAEPSIKRGHSLALGEPAEGLAGWRLTHRQAAAVLPIARRGPEKTVRYAQAALLAAALQDELLDTSLRRLYLAPLQAERDSGATLLQTIRAYLAADRNSASAAAALGVTRQTINNRLRVIEERIGRPLETCAGDLAVALGLDALKRRGSGT